MPADKILDSVGWVLNHGTNPAKPDAQEFFLSYDQAMGMALRHGFAAGRTVSVYDWDPEKGGAHGDPILHLEGYDRTKLDHKNLKRPHDPDQK